MYETARCSVRPLLAVVVVFEEAAALEEEAGFGSALALALALALEGPAMGPEEEGDAARISGGEGVDAGRDGLSPPPFDLFLRGGHTGCQFGSIRARERVKGAHVVEFPGLFPLVCLHGESFVALGPTACSRPRPRSSRTALRGGSGCWVWRGNGQGVVLLRNDEGLWSGSGSCRHLCEDLRDLLVIARRHGAAVECSAGGGPRLRNCARDLQLSSPCLSLSVDPLHSATA
jgi:hypothetical protein